MYSLLWMKVIKESHWSFNLPFGLYWPSRCLRVSVSFFQRVEQLTSHCEDAINLLRSTISSLESTVLPHTAEVINTKVVCCSDYITVLITSTFYCVLFRQVIAINAHSLMSLTPPPPSLDGFVMTNSSVRWKTWNRRRLPYIFLQKKKNQPKCAHYYIIKDHPL